MFPFSFYKPLRVGSIAGSISKLFVSAAGNSSLFIVIGSINTHYSNFHQNSPSSIERSVELFAASYAATKAQSFVNFKGNAVGYTDGTHSIQPSLRYVEIFTGYPQQMNESFDWCKVTLITISKINSIAYWALCLAQSQRDTPKSDAVIYTMCLRAAFRQALTSMPQPDAAGSS